MRSMPGSWLKSWCRSLNCSTDCNPEARDSQLYLSGDRAMFEMCEGERSEVCS